jgi:hypothetical protein
VIEFVYFPVPPCARREREVTADTLPKWKLVQMRMISQQALEHGESFAQEQLTVRAADRQQVTA